MIHKFSRYLLTLVALLAMTTGAWADGIWTSGGCTLKLEGTTLTVSKNTSGQMADYTYTMKEVGTMTPHRSPAS